MIISKEEMKMTAIPKTYNKIINSKEYQEFFDKFSDFATDNLESTLRALKEKTDRKSVV